MSDSQRQQERHTCFACQSPSGNQRLWFILYISSQYNDRDRVSLLLLWHRNRTPESTKKCSLPTFSVKCCAKRMLLDIAITSIQTGLHRRCGPPHSRRGWIKLLAVRMVFILILSFCIVSRCSKKIRMETLATRDSFIRECRALRNSLFLVSQHRLLKIYSSHSTIPSFVIPCVPPTKSATSAATTSPLTA